MNALLIILTGLAGTLAWLSVVHLILKRRECSKRERYRNLITSKMEDLRQLQEESSEILETKTQEVPLTFIFEKNLMEVKP